MLKGLRTTAIEFKAINGVCIPLLTLLFSPSFDIGNTKGMPCGKTCKEDRDDEWMGVSLARQPKAGGSILVRSRFP